MIILFQGEYTVKYASYVAYFYVFCLKFVVQMDNVGMCRVLDSEIIDNEGVWQFACFVSEKSMGVFYLCVAKYE